jgi:hypothetical protein
MESTKTESKGWGKAKIIRAIGITQLYPWQGAEAGFKFGVAREDSCRYGRGGS